MEFHKDTPVGRIASEHPGATRVFHRFGIDFCCGGGKSIEVACQAKGVDPTTVLEAVQAELLDGDADATDWLSASPADLIDHILNAYHKPLGTELPRLSEMVQKVAEVHHDKDARLAELRSVFSGLKSELESHMMKEEQILFPMIVQGQGESAGGPITVMEQEHDSAGAALRQIRELTDGFQPPEEACNTWRALFSGLEDLEREMHQHIHLENNILFPQALGK